MCNLNVILIYTNRVIFCGKIILLDNTICVNVKEGRSMKVETDVLNAVKRKRGELNISITELGNQTQVSRSTLSNLLNGNRFDVTPRTQNKLVKWLARNS